MRAEPYVELRMGTCEGSVLKAKQAEADTNSHKRGNTQIMLATPVTFFTFHGTPSKPCVPKSGNRRKGGLKVLTKGTILRRYL